MSDTGVVRLLLFRVGGLVCAAEAERVREIVPWFEPTRIPGAPPVVAGVVNVRGTLVTVVEGGRALRQPEPAADGGGRGSGTTVLLEVGGGKKVLGFTVDEVVDLVSVGGERSEEHTSELQSQSNLVCRLLLEKKKKDTRNELHDRHRK